jgi:flagellar basal-body rod protein FlgB
MAGDISFLSALKMGMRWHQARQRLLSENIANANSAGYKPRDLAPLSFESSVKMTGFSPTLVASSTDPGHFGFSSSSGNGDTPFAEVPPSRTDVTPDGNGVALEEQMMKITANQLDYQAVTTLYSRGLGLIRTAIKRTT